MTIRILILVVLILISCGDTDYLFKSNTKADSCSVYTIDEGAIIVCTNGTSAKVFNGKDGEQGLPGEAGKQGESGNDGAQGLPGEQGVAGVNGIDGKNGLDGKDGINGKDGVDGNNGKDGTNGLDGKNGTDGNDGSNGTDGIDGTNGIDGLNGSSCSTYKTNNGIEITCEDGTYTFIESNQVKYSYEGIFCDKIIISLFKDFYIIDNFNMYKLNKNWYKVSSTYCKVRILDDKVQENDSKGNK